MNVNRITNLSAVLLLIIVVLSSLVILATTRTQLGGLKLLVVTSGSMEPSIDTGSLVLSQTQSEYDVGQVVTYHSQITSSDLITHRIVDKHLSGGEAQFVLQGDANPTQDVQTIPASAIVGRVVFLLPWIGYLIAFLKTPVGVTLFIVIPGTLLIYEELRNIHRTIKGAFFKAPLMIILFLSYWGLQQVESTWSTYTTQGSQQAISFKTTAWLETNLSHTQQGQSLLTQIVDELYDEAEYEIVYQHWRNGTWVTESIVGELHRSSLTVNFSVPPVYLGSCSSENVCTPHQQIRNLETHFLFKKNGDMGKVIDTLVSWQN